MKKIRFNSPVVLSFALISGIALIANYMTAGWSNTQFFMCYKGSWTDPLTYLRLFTHVLGHADWNHYSNNMILFLLVGPLLEEKYGSLNLFEIIIAVAFVTGIVHVFLPGSTGLLGASGIVFAFILLASITGEGKGIPMTLLIAAAFYISQQIYEGIIVKDNISQLTHIISGSIGAFFGLFMSGSKK